MSTRTLGLSGATNFRDLGGYRTEGGGTVRWRRLYRSNHLGDLTAEDHAALAELGLRRICDLRSTAEHKTTVPVIAGATVHSLPIEPSVTRDIRTLIASGGEISPDMVTELMEETYREFVRGHSEAYRALFDHLLDGDGPIVFHCSAGKDRTGFAAAAVLAALGVPRATIVDDYLMTNALWRTGATTLSGLPPAAMAVLLRAEARFLDAAFDAIDADHGDVEGYLRDALGVDVAERRRLVQLYVER